MISLLNCKQIAPKLNGQLKILENRLEIKELENVIYGSIETWLLWKLSREKSFATEITCACCTGFYDIFWVFKTKFNPFSQKQFMFVKSDCKPA